MLHLPQEAGKGGGWTEKMECGCGGSSLHCLLPQTRALPSSAEAEEHMLTLCPSPRCGRQGAPSPTALLRTPGSAARAQTSNQELFRLGLDQHDLARLGVRGSRVGERVLRESGGEPFKRYINELRDTSHLG